MQISHTRLSRRLDAPLASGSGSTTSEIYVTSFSEASVEHFLATGRREQSQQRHSSDKSRSARERKAENWPLPSSPAEKVGADSVDATFLDLGKDGTHLGAREEN